MLERVRERIHVHFMYLGMHERLPTACTRARTRYVHMPVRVHVLLNVREHVRVNVRMLVRKRVPVEVPERTYAFMCACAYALCTR